MSRLPPRRALAVVAVALMVAVSWQLGRMSTRWAALETLDGAVEASRSVGVRDEADAADDPDDVSKPAQGSAQAVAAERDAAVAGMHRLEERLAESGRVADDDAAELELYRRIESGTQAKGLSVDTVELVDGGTDRAALDVTLVQSQGRRRVTGSLEVGLIVPALAAARPGDDSIDDPSAARVREQDALLGGEPMPFDLRFYQTLRVPLGAAAPGVTDGEDGIGAGGSDGPGSSLAPARVRLEVRPDGDRHEPFVAIVPIGTNVAAPPRE